MTEELSISETAPSRPSFLKRHRTLLMVGGPLLVVLIGGFIWLTGGRYAATDDAYIQTGKVQITASASGQVVELAVRDNQRVRKGQLLFRLEDNTPRVAAEQADAALNSARAQVLGYRATYRQRVAELATAQANLSFRQRELSRNRTLAASGVVSKEEVDEAVHEAEAAAGQVAARREQVAAASALLGGAGDANNPAVLQARAQLDRALLDRADTIVRAPQDGVVTRVSQLQVGSYVRAATPVFSLVTDEIWIEANFKEGDLAHMRPGQHATVEVDAHPGLRFDAVVQSLSPGTGSSFALLPPENATGNWVKVVQRVPVRLTFTRRPDTMLQSGLSALVKVDTQYRRFGRSAPAR